MSNEQVITNIPAYLLYSTWPDAEDAEACGRRLINERLAACVNILPQARSIWRDGDDVQTSSEVIMIIKTTKALAQAACARTVGLHPYDTPAVLALPVDGRASSLVWLDWLEVSVLAG